MPDLDDLLEKTSRTFALSIPLLPPPTRQEVTLAYLLFRIADTFEDATVWPPERRVQALTELRELLASPQQAEIAARLAQGWMDPPPHDRHQGYVELVRETPFVMELFWELRPEAQAIICRHLTRTIEGMEQVVASSEATGRLQLGTLADLRRYCYIVAGIVGEMLTDLYLLHGPDLARIAETLRARARLFGEGLQLVNILKDASVDWQDGRRYLPAQVGRSQVFELARQDLVAAAEYTLALQQAEAPRGLVAFNALPILLARASLDQVEAEGPGAKIGRDRVFALVADMEMALDAGAPVV